MAAAIGVAMIAVATPAYGDTIVSIGNGDHTIDSGVGRDDQNRGGGSGGPVCTYQPIPAQPFKPVSGDNPVDDGTGSWFLKMCDGNFAGVVYISRTNPTELLALARQRLTLPVPTVRLSPSARQLVHVPTWMWIDPESWHVLTSTAAVPGVAVTVTARPVATVWRMGDGRTVTCRDGGTPFDATRDDPALASTCSHTFRQSSTGRPDVFHGSVTVEWAASWSALGAAGAGTLTGLSRTAPFTVTVAEVQALNRTAGR
jgi:hypothetical protein